MFRGGSTSGGKPPGVSGKPGGVEGSYILCTSQGTGRRCNLEGEITMSHQQSLCVQKLGFFQSSFLLQMLLPLRHLLKRLGTGIGSEVILKQQVPDAPAPIMATDLMRS